MTTFSDFEKEIFLIGYDHIAGVDEVGRGPLAGPVVAAAVIFSCDTLIEGINDSKQLSCTRREYLAEKISEKAITIGVGVVPPHRIDELNILHASIEAMHSAIRKLNPQPDYLLIDGNKFYHDELPFTTIIQGDAHCFSIAAASIIAKVYRDRLMTRVDELYPDYGFAKHKGYPTKQHIQALKKFGPSEIHRRSFVVKELVQQMKIF